MLLLQIKKRSDFLALSKDSLYFHSPTTLVLAGKTAEQYLVNPHTKTIDNFCRVGYTVSKKVGNAVIRNKAKRRYRQIFQQIYNQHGLNHFDYVVIAKKSTSTCQFKNLHSDLELCLKGIKRLAQKNEPKKI